MSCNRMTALVANAALATAILASPARAAVLRKPHPDLTVYIAASQPTAPTYQATSKASAIFRSIGVEVAWVTGKPKHPTEGTAIEVQLATDTPDPLLPGALAVSHPYNPTMRTITVFYDRVQRRSQESGTPERMLLAHVLVHEITHLLEGSERHSASGVMKAHWTSADYATMARRPLGFDADDIYWIHRYLENPAATISRPKAAAN